MNFGEVLPEVQDAGLPFFYFEIGIFTQCDYMFTCILVLFSFKGVHSYDTLEFLSGRI